MSVLSMVVQNSIYAITLVGVGLVVSDRSLAAQSTQALRRQIDAEVENVVQRENIPAISVGVIRAGKIFHFKSVGQLNRKSDKQVDGDSVFQIASLSKMFTGIIANNLIAEKMLDPKQSIVSYLSSVIDDKAIENLSNVTLGDLLHHHSGISDEACMPYRDRIEGEAWLNGYSRDELTADVSKLIVKQNTETQYQYSSCGYAIAGLISELVSGKNYAALLQQYVTEPYGLQNTAVLLNSSQLNILTPPYRKGNREVQTQPSKMGKATPASAIYSNTSALLKLQLQQIQAYQKFNTNHAPSPLILTEQTSVTADSFIRYGLGLMVFELPKGSLYGHDGDADGYASFYAFSVAHNIGLVLLTSSGGPWVAELSMFIIGSLIDDSLEP